MTTFQRAHSDEQREIRRRAILDGAAAMLSEMPVAQITLSELSRRVGLAKSNVLRYFESREAVLLELAMIQSQRWLDQLDALPDPTGDVKQRSEGLVAALVSSLEKQPVLCDLISTQAAVLERNISAEVALTYKRAGITQVEALARIIGRMLPELVEPDTMWFAGATILQTGAIWTHAHPTPAVIAVYDANPTIAAWRMDFAGYLRTILLVLLTGLLTSPGSTA